MQIPTQKVAKEKQPGSYCEEEISSNDNMTTNIEKL